VYCFYFFFNCINSFIIYIIGVEEKIGFYLNSKYYPNPINVPSMIPAITSNGIIISKNILIEDRKFFLIFLRSVPSLIPNAVLIKIAGISKIP